jgi:hypothetical protein
VGGSIFKDLGAKVTWVNWVKSSADLKSKCMGFSAIIGITPELRSNRVKNVSGTANQCIPLNKKDYEFYLKTKQRTNCVKQGSQSDV